MPGKRRRLAARRRAVGYAQERLAVVLDVERSTVQRWEAGETTPQPWCRPKLAKVLGVSMEELEGMLAEGQAGDEQPSASGQLLDEVDAAEKLPDNPGQDPVLVAPWNHRGTVEAVVMVSGGDRVKRRALLLTGPALTAPAHQWLVHEPGPLVSGLSGRRVAPRFAERLTTMVTEVENSVALYDDSLPSGGHAGYLIALADVLARPGKQRDLDAAANRGMEAIQLVENLDSPRVAGLIRDLVHQLTPDTKVPAVGDFVERARGLVTA